MIRCPLCASPSNTTLRRPFLLCNLCALVFSSESGPLPLLESYRRDGGAFDFPNWKTWRSFATRGPQPHGSPVLFTPTTVRIFAAREGMQATRARTALPLLPMFADWPYGRTIRAELTPRARRAGPSPDRRLTIGVIAARHAAQDALDLRRSIAGLAAEMIVVLDAADPAEATALEHAFREQNEATPTRVIAHPLRADFSAQRNVVQDAATTGWVLHLDCDERLAPGAREAISWLIDEAERHGDNVIGLTRQNLVDGVISALYPDMQYRFLRRALRFEGAVHEHPQSGGPQRNFVHLGPGIVHTLSRERLGQREQVYEAMQSGAGRPDDTALLRRPLAHDVAVPR